MPDNKYKFNPNTLEFEHKGRSKAEKMLVSGISILIGGVFIFLLIFIIFSFIYDAKNKRESDNEYKILKEQYQVLSERKLQNDKYLEELIEKDKAIYQAVFKTMPDNSVFDKKNPFAKFSDKDLRIIFDENSLRISGSEKVLQNHKKQYSEIIKILKKKEPKDLKAIPAIQPIFNNYLKYPVYGFGNKIDQVYKSLVFHPGIDYAAPEGTVVFATAEGKVKKAGRVRGLGNRIIIDHGNGYKTLYAHLDDINVFQGKKVERGDKIATVGLTGKALIPHLHYEVIYKGKQVNPVNYFFLDLNPDKFFKINEMASKSGISLD